MIIVYAGVQADEPERMQPRFPRAAEERLAARIRGLLQSLRPSLVVGAAASGSDIVIAEAALLEGADVRFVMPFDVETFQKSSVEGRGQRWTARYQRLLQTVGSNRITEGSLDPDDKDSYPRHNAHLITYAKALARERGERVWALVVRPQPDDDAGSVSDDFAQRAEAQGILTLDLAPLAKRPRGFVAMPYGLRFDPVVRRRYDCDPVFHRIYRPLLEDLDVDWARADLETDSGIIHAGMIEDLANSDVVIVDLATANFNVAYELGLRHVFARSSTVLVYPQLQGTRVGAAPFDINLIRIHRFERGTELTDEQSEGAIRRLRPALAEVLASRSSDSPVHEWFELGGVRGPFRRKAGQDGPVETDLRLRKTVQSALRSASTDSMLAAAAEIAEASDLSESSRIGLRIQLGNGLIRESAYEAATALLEQAEPPADSPLRRPWLQKLAMAYRRIGESSRCSRATAATCREKAQRLLSTAIQEGFGDSETYGILAGLNKRALENRKPAMDNAGVRGRFALMQEYYRKGFEVEPTFYTGVNLVMALRLGIRHGVLAEGAAEAEDRLQEALTVTKFLARRAAEADPTDFWAAVSQAELLLHESFMGRIPAADAVAAYGRAAALARPDQLRSTIYQLDFLQRWGDPENVIDPIRTLFGTVTVE
ncbi:MAG: hypothetical protein JWO93_3359 [Micrococcaceae bacterium]|nr:hypothetical protein [Micrococcaceae bacterium]